MSFLKRFFAALIVIVAVGCVAANADTLNTLTGTVTADDTFIAYISTSDSTLGTEFASTTPSDITGHASTWEVQYPISTLLGNNTTYYLHIVVANGGGGPEAFTGTFSLAGTSFQFSNGTQTLGTNATNWTGAENDGSVTYVGGVGSVSSWAAPSALASLENTGTYNTYNGIYPGAEWIWSQGGSESTTDVADLSTTITSRITATPEPGSFILLGSGLLGLAGVVRRKFGICA
jgi:hypothetical protein